MQFSKQDIRDTIRNAICRSLACDPEEVTDDSRLIDDLGMDSLDFLDVVFSLEKVFQTKMRDGAINRFLRPDKFEIAEMEPYLTSGEIENLVPMMPALAGAAEEGPVPRQKLFSFITLNTLVKMVTEKLTAQDDG
jgi:acyl carrier protein